jgi:hypothetical protein
MKILKFLLILIIGAAISAGLYFGYQFYMQAKEKPINALYLIPDNSAIIIGSPEYSSLKEEWAKSAELSELFEKDQNFSNIINELDSLNIDVSKLTDGKDIKTSFYYSIHFVGHHRFASLISYSFSKNLSRSEFENSISKIGNIKKREFESKTIYDFSFKNNKKKFYISFEHSNVFLSTYEPLLERLILEESTKSQEKEINIARLIKISGKDAAATIYFNYRYLYRLISSFSQKNYIDIIKQLSHLSQYSALDFSSQNNSISLSGYSFSNDSVPSLLSTFNDFEAPQVEIYKHIPAQTILLYYQGANKLNEYLEKRKSSSYNTENTMAMQSYKADLLIDVSDYFYPWIQNELAFGLTSNNNSNAEGFAIANTYDPKEAMQTLGKLENIANEFKNSDADTIFYRSYQIHFIPLPYLLSNVFGELFSPIQQTYYCAIGNYIVFGNSPETLKSYIDNMLIEKSLANREDFNEFSSKLSSQANIVLYANMHYFNIISKQVLGIETNSYLKSSSMNLQDLGDAAIEFIADEKGAYTSVILNKTNWEEEADKVSWQAALDYPIAKGPFLFENHQTNKIDFIVFDTHNQMYRINHLGQIVWAIPVAELPLGDISIVDYYKNGKHQFLYNSKNYLYLYDLNGNKVENYPIALNIEATAPLTLIDYDKKNNYRILVPMSDGKIHNFKIEGEETVGWQNPEMPALVNTKIQYFKLGTKDFIILADTAGNVLFSNRRGEARIEARLAFTNDIETKFYKKSNKLITTDRIGRIITIDATGLVEKKLIGDFGSDFKFDFIDVNQDDKKDYLFFDRNSILAFNQNGDTIWTKISTDKIYPKIESLYGILIDSCGLLAFNSDKNLFELIDSKGNFIEKEEYSASNNFIIYEATKDNKIRLISSKNRVISNYLLK